MFLQITEGLWSHCTPHCQGPRQAHAICQIDGKVEEWGLRHPLLIHTFVFYVSHLDVVWKPHLCNLLLGTAWKLSLCSIQTLTGERIMVLRNYCYLWASASKCDNYRHPFTANSSFFQCCQGPGNHCHVGLFMLNQWEVWLFVSLGGCTCVCGRLNETNQTPRFTRQESFHREYPELHMPLTVDKYSMLSHYC